MSLPVPRTDAAPTASYEYVPGTAEEFAALLDVLSVLVPEEQEDAENDDGTEA